MTAAARWRAIESSPETSPGPDRPARELLTGLAAPAAFPAIAGVDEVLVVPHASPHLFSPGCLWRPRSWAATARTAFPRPSAAADKPRPHARTTPSTAGRATRPGEPGPDRAVAWAESSRLDASCRAISPNGLRALPSMTSSSCPGSSPSAVVSSSRGAPAAQACGVDAVGYWTGRVLAGDGIGKRWDGRVDVAVRRRLCDVRVFGAATGSIVPVAADGSPSRERLTRASGVEDHGDRGRVR
jgi:hypothetical protein